MLVRVPAGRAPPRVASLGNACRAAFDPLSPSEGRPKAGPGTINTPRRRGGPLIDQEGRVVSATDYIVNLILLLLVLRHMHETRLPSPGLVLPVLLVAAAAAAYLRAVPTAGNDVALEITLTATGLALGVLCAMATRIRRGADGVALVRAGWVAASLWAAEIGARVGFAFAASHGAGPAIARFSAAHGITSGRGWAAALALMALAELTARLAVLRLRARRLPAAEETATWTPVGV